MATKITLNNKLKLGVKRYEKIYEKITIITLMIHMYVDKLTKE